MSIINYAINTFGENARKISNLFSWSCEGTTLITINISFSCDIGGGITLMLWTQCHKRTIVSLANDSLQIGCLRVHFLFEYLLPLEFY